MSNSNSAKRNTSKILEGAVSNKYTYKPYSKKFNKIFFSEKRKIARVLLSIKKKEIHHIGSTSVPNLGGKGIIDIIVIVPKKSISKAKKLLEGAKFKHEHTMRERHFHSKYYVDTSLAPRLIHLHLAHFDSNELNIALSFRDYLRSHKKVRDEYASIKRKASLLHSKDSKKYVEYKRLFVESTLQKALKWYKKRDC